MVTEPKRFLGALWASMALTAAVGSEALSAAPPSDPEPEASGRTLTASESYVRFPAIQTAVQSDRRMRGMLQVRMALDAPQSRTRRLIDDREMWLRDAYAETLLLYGARIYRWGQVPDADMISQLLQEDTDRLLGEGRAQVVLDTVVIHAG